MPPSAGRRVAHVGVVVARSASRAAAGRSGPGRGGSGVPRTAAVSRNARHQASTPNSRAPLCQRTARSQSSPRSEPVQRGQLVGVGVRDGREVAAEQRPCRAGAASRGRSARVEGHQPLGEVGGEHRGVQVHPLVALGEVEEVPVLRHAQVRDDQLQPRDAARAARPPAPARCARPAIGPEPQWMTTGVPVSSSRAHTASSSGCRGSKPPTCTCTLNTRAPRSQRLGDVGRRLRLGVEGGRLAAPAGAASANSADQSLSQAAMPGLCG